MQFTKCIEDEKLSPFFLEPLLSARLTEVSVLLNQKERELKKAPTGSLRISKTGTSIQYYQITKSGDTRGHYIPAKKFKLAQELAQKDYNQKLIKRLQKELKFLKKTLRSYRWLNKSTKPAPQIFEKLNRQRRPLIKAACLPDSDFAEIWQNISYEGKAFTEDTPTLLTSRDEKVRSKSEIIIADALNRLGIPYRYEYPLEITNEKGIRKTFYPDFICLNLRSRQEFIWEHFGLMDDAEYAAKTTNKLKLYEKNGIYPGKNLIISTETADSPINPKQVEKTARQYLL